MRKSISTQELRNKVGEIVDSVRLHGDRYIIERRGIPVAAVVPVEESERYDQERAKFFDLVDNIHQRNRGIPEEEIQTEIDRAIEEVRSERGKRLATA